MRIEIYRSAGGVLWWRQEDRILHLQMNDGYEATGIEAEELIAATEHFLAGAKAPLLIDRTHSYSPSFAALRITSTRIPEFVTAIAYYAPTLHARLASENVRKVFLATIGHVEIFSQEGDAVKWLASFVPNRAPAS